MMKKALSLILSISMLMTSLVIVKAETSEAATDTTAAVVIDPTVKAVVDYTQNGFEIPMEDTVMRSDFLQAVMRLKGTHYDGAVDENGFTFEDVAADSNLAGVVAAAVTAGVISEGTKFYPKDNVTYAQAAKMLVSALGYHVSEGTYGASLDTFYRQAVRLDIFDNVDCDPSAALKTADAYTLLYNTLHVALVEQELQGSGDRYIISDKTILNRYFHIYYVDGIVEADNMTGIVAVADKTGDGWIKVGGDLFQYDGKENLIGYRVRVYYEEVDRIDEEKKIVHLYKYKNDVKEVLGKDFDSYADNTFTYKKSATTKRHIKLDSEFSVIRNRNAYYPDNMTDFFNTPASTYVFIDNNGDDRYDVIQAKAYEYTHISSIDTLSKTISDKNDSANTIELKDTDYVIYENFFDGTKEISIEDLKTNTLIGHMSTNDKSFYEIWVLDEVVTGTLDSIGRDTIRVNGQNFDIDEATKAKFNLKVGSIGKFYLGINGEVVSYVKASSSTMLYAVLIKATADDVKEEYGVKMFCQDGEMHRYMMAPKKVTVDGERKTPQQAYEILKAVTERKETYRPSLGDQPNDTAMLVRYSLNDDGELAVIDTINEGDYTYEETTPASYRENEKIFYNSTLTIADMDAYEAADDNNKIRIFYKRAFGRQASQYKASNRVFGQKFKIDSSTIIFTIPDGEKTDDDYTVATTSLFADDWNGQNNDSITAYDLDPNTMNAGALVYTGAGAGTEPSNEEASIGVVASKQENVDPVSGDILYRFSIWNWSTQKFVDVYAKEDLGVPGETIEAGLENIVNDDGTDNKAARLHNPAVRAEAGDIIRYELDQQGYISVMSVDYDLSKNQMYKGGNQVEYHNGIVYRYDNGSISMIEDIATAPSEAELSSIKLASLLTTTMKGAVLVEINGTPGNINDLYVSNIPITGLKTIKSSAEDADFIVSRFRHYIGIVSVIYRYVD